MSKWRPSENCFYVISDIHGMYDPLQLILSRILPLRKTGGHTDTILFLGDYIDKNTQSDKVIDLLIDLQKKEQIICLIGNHEYFMLDVLNSYCPIEIYTKWMKIGGDKTLYGYLQRNNFDIQNPYLFQRKDIGRLIPLEHINFINNLIPYYENDKYIFVHGGCDPYIPLKNQNSRILSSDRSVYINVKKFKEGKFQSPWLKTIITGHNGDFSGKAFIYSKFMMLDCSPINRIRVLELNSMTSFYAEIGNKRLVKESIIGY
jgi:serine/threonine protein phosphatase 1